MCVCVHATFYIIIQSFFCFLAKKVAAEKETKFEQMMIMYIARKLHTIHTVILLTFLRTHMLYTTGSCAFFDFCKLSPQRYLLFVRQSSPADFGFFFKTSLSASTTWELSVPSA